ncbi:TPM domain-containing protein [Dongia sedimenti]|uniref:TPM domain-containing protein n=1 Tax=Dongia sedimenti TaxID=3064282 RepID=A0ABU0YIZ9_9PROT|nr:TPM domain-containing protein [Rhodospirillaceae bacterium R-7]
MIDDGMRTRIGAAIAKAEQGTRAEFVAAVARRADDYRSNSLLAGLVGGLIGGIAAWTLLPWPGAGETIVCELAGFLLAFALAAFTPLGIRIVPVRRQRRLASRLAKLVFLQRGLASTPERCGVLFFVSRAEHYVEIVADRGIDQAVEPGAWQRIVDAFTAAVKRGEVEQGYLGAIEALGALLAQHYPPQGDNPNRIPDRLVEL